MSQRDVWNRIARSWKGFRTKPMKEVREFLAVAEEPVLDIGCGSGRHMIQDKQIYGIDFAYNMLLASGKPNVAAADAASLPFRNNSFKSVICIAVLHSMKERDKCLDEITRVAAPGSLVMFTVWNRRQPRFLFSGKETYVSWAGNMRYYYLFTKKELQKLLEKHGFQDIIVKGGSDKAFKMFPRNIIAIARVPKSGQADRQKHYMA